MNKELFKILIPSVITASISCGSAPIAVIAIGVSYIISKKLNEYVDILDTLYQHSTGSKKP